MDFDEAYEMARDFVQWVEAVTQQTAANILGVHASTISRQKAIAEAEGRIGGDTEKAFRKRWIRARKLGVPLADPVLDSVQTSDDEIARILVESGVTDASPGDEALSDESVSEADIPPWTGRYAHIPGIVHAVPLAQEHEGQIHGPEMAEKIRLWRYSRQRFDEASNSTVKNAFTRMPEVRLGRIESMETEWRLLEVEVDLIDNHGATLPPNDAPYSGMQRIDAIESRQLRMEELRKGLLVETFYYNLYVGSTTWLLWLPLTLVLQLIKVLFKIITWPFVALVRLLRRK